MDSSDQLTAGLMRSGCCTEAAAILHCWCTFSMTCGTSASPKYKSTKESVIFNLKSLLRTLTSTNAERLAGDLWMCCRANLSPAEMNKAI